MRTAAERKTGMNEEQKKSLESYLVSMSVIAEMLREGIITEEEYADIDTIIANKHGISSCSIYR